MDYHEADGRAKFMVSGSWFTVPGFWFTVQMDYHNPYGRAEIPFVPIFPTTMNGSVGAKCLSPYGQPRKMLVEIRPVPTLRERLRFLLSVVPSE